MITLSRILQAEFTMAFYLRSDKCGFKKSKRQGLVKSVKKILIVYAFLLFSLPTGWELKKEFVTPLIPDSNSEDLGRVIYKTYERESPRAVLEIILTEGAGTGNLYVPESVNISKGLMPASKYKILEIFYCAKKYNSNKDNNESKYNFSVTQLLKENLYLRKCVNKTDNINLEYFIKLENDIRQQFKYKELLNQKKFLEEEKNNEENNINLSNNINQEKEENQINNENNNPFKFINENNANTSNNNKINHKRQKTQYKLNFSENKKNEIISNQSEEEFDLNNNNINNSDSLSNYLNEMNNNILMSRTKNSSQKNLLNKNKNDNLINKKENNTINKDNNSTIPENNNSYSEQSFDSIVHVNKENKINKSDNELDNEKDNINKKLSGMSSDSTVDKYSQRIEFTK